MNRMAVAGRRTLRLSLLAAAALVLSVGGTRAESPALGSPMTLEQCWAVALERNPQIAAGAQGVEGARASLLRARSPYYPQLFLSASQGVVSRTSAGLVGEDRGGAARRDEADLVAGQTVWRLGLQESVRETESQLQAAEYDYGSLVQSLLEQVASDYYAVLATEQLVAVAESAVEAARGNLALVEARIALGAAAEVDVYPVRDDLARAELDLIDARGNVRLALARLKNTLGLPAETELALAPASDPEEERVPDLTEALAVARARRLEMMSAEASRQARESGLQQARYRRGPVAEVAGQYRAGVSDGESRDPSWNLLLSLSWPLFDGGSTRAEVLSARASLARAAADEQRIANQVGLEVESALVAVDRSWERVEASKQSVAAAEARLAAAEGKYRQGVGILIEVIDARVAVTSAQAAQVRARYDYQTALVGLQRSLGTLAPPAAAPGESWAERREPGS